MTDGLKLGLFGLHRSASAEPDALTRRARLAEAAGFESLWVGDHIILPGGAGDHPRLEAVTALTYLAAVTTRIGLAAGVFVLPQRQPVLFAKQLACVDVLSKGRLTVGIGVGYVEDEMRALGASLADRGARTDEYLAAMRALWTSAEFTGEFVSFTGIQRPTPIQQPYPPIVIGGHSPAAYRRAVQQGNGWYGWDLNVDQTATAVAELRLAADKYPRPAELGDLEITITPAGPVDIDLARRYADLGVHRLAVLPSDSAPATMDELISSIGETVIGQV
jgi:probable F420-dependent oxidoreductase